MKYILPQAQMYFDLQRLQMQKQLNWLDFGERFSPSSNNMIRIRSFFCLTYVQLPLTSTPKGKYLVNGRGERHQCKKERDLYKVHPKIFFYKYVNIKYINPIKCSWKAFKYKFIYNKFIYKFIYNINNINNKYVFEIHQSFIRSF
jgi:hypothetical protein